MSAEDMWQLSKHLNLNLTNSKTAKQDFKRQLQGHYHSKLPPSPIMQHVLRDLQAALGAQRERSVYPKAGGVWKGVTGDIQALSNEEMLKEIRAEGIYLT